MKEFKLSPKMENYKSTKETLKYDFNVEQIYLPQKYLKKSNQVNPYIIV